MISPHPDIPVVDQLHDAHHGQFNDGDTRAAFAAGFKAGVQLGRATAHSAYVVGQAIGVHIDATPLIEAMADGFTKGAARG